MAKFSLPKNDDIRIVAVNAHHDSGEIEVVLEIETRDMFAASNRLVSCWIDKMEVVKKILQDESEKS
jgi:hypothetical protein